MGRESKAREGLLGFRERNEAKDSYGFLEENKKNFSERKEIWGRKERALGVARFHVRDETRVGRGNLGEGEEGHEQTGKEIKSCNFSDQRLVISHVSDQISL